MKKTSTPKKQEKDFVILKEESREIKNVSLEGTVLKLECEVSTFDVVKQIHPKTQKPHKVIDKVLKGKKMEIRDIKLVEVTEKEIAAFRREGVPSFVLKKDWNLYHAKIPANMSLMTHKLLGEHKCTNGGKICKRLSAASDEEGGCAKVRGRSRGIERYIYIKEGYETFNTKFDMFFVENCYQYEESKPRQKRSLQEIRKAKLALKEYMIENTEYLTSQNYKNYGK